MTQEIQKYLSGSFGKTIFFYDQVDSTNNAARNLAKEGAPHGTAVVAARQTAGKGRLGRSFDSPSGAGVYLSVILRPSLTVEKGTLLTPAAAVATARAIEKTSGVRVRIKWVNDLYLNGKKLCGILTESALRPDGMLDWAVVGIGVNLKETSRPASLQDKITSLEAVGGETSFARLAAEILNELEKLCEDLSSVQFLEEYRTRSCVLGKTVTVIQGENSYQAYAHSITDDAGLIVKTEAGEYLTLRSGEISLRGDF